MVPKGTPQEGIDKLAATVLEMFRLDRVTRKMKTGGSPMNVLAREEVQAMWSDRQGTMTELLKGL